MLPNEGVRRKQKTASRLAQASPAAVVQVVWDAGDAHQATRDYLHGGHSAGTQASGTAGAAAGAPGSAWDPLNPEVSIPTGARRSLSWHCHEICWALAGWGSQTSTS